MITRTFEFEYSHEGNLKTLQVSLNYEDEKEFHCEDALIEYCYEKLEEVGIV